MTTIDIAVIAVYLTGMLIIGYFSGKKNTTQDDYFLAGRSMPWLPVALSIAATMVSANGFIGGPGWAYSGGLAPFMVNVTVPLAVLFAISVTTPVIYSMRLTSVYQYIEKRFGRYTRALTITQFFINSIIQVSSMVFIPVLILQTMTGWSFHITVPIVVITALIYTLMGGIKAVIWTDAVQMSVVIGAIFMVIYIVLSDLGIGIMDTMMLAKEAGKLDTLSFSTDVTVTNTFWATLIGGSAMWIRYFCFDQSQVQRILTSKSLKEAKDSFVLSSLVMNVVYFLMMIIGIMLFVFYKGKSFSTSNEIMISFVLEEMPVGVIGLIIASVFAAAMSSIDSLLNSMATVFTKDVYEPLTDNREASLKVSMLISVFIGLLIIVFVYIGFNGTAKSVLYVVGKYISYFAGPACGTFLLAMFTYKANDKGAALGFLAGLVLGYFVSFRCSVSWLWNPFIGVTITTFTGYFSSCLFPGKITEEQKLYTVWGMRNTLKRQHKEDENGISVLPFSFGRHEKTVLAFFLFQYVFLAFIQYR